MKKFSSAYQQLPPKLRAEVKERITKEVFMVNNAQTFYNKKNGREKITDFEWSRLQSVFSEYGIDVETGKLFEQCQQI